MFDPSKLSHLLEEAKPEASPYTLEHLAGWLETKSGPYDWFSIERCLICQYLDFIGVKYSSVGRLDYVTPDSKRRINIPEYFATVSAPYPNTFGAALSRTRAAIAARSAQ